MNEDMSFEDIARQFLQQSLIPQSVVDDVKEVERILKCGYISKEDAEKRLEGIAADLKKLQDMVTGVEVRAIHVEETDDLFWPEQERQDRS